MVAAGVTLALALAAIGLTTAAWAGDLRDDGRLLPGTSVASIDVSGLAVEEARSAVAGVLDDRLERTVTVTYEDRTFTTTPRELGASSDLDQVLAAAVERTGSASFTELVQARWLGASPGDGGDIAVQIEDDAVVAFVATVADEVDRDARDATIEIEGDELEVVAASQGTQVDRDAAVAAVLAEISQEAEDGQDDDGTEVALPVEVLEPAVATAQAQEVVDATDAALAAALDRAVTVTLTGDSRQVTPRELGAGADVAALVADGLDGDLPGADDVAVTVGGDAIAGLLSEVASGKEASARDAELDVSGGDFSITPERTGAAVSRGPATEALRAALTGGDDVVELELVTVEPSVTSSSFDTVLVLQHGAREVSLYRGGEATGSWPVAIGASSSPTPLGQFTIGAKRFEPTWVNPAQDRWGADMPARMGPGPDNPLGARALNWNDANGRDTLIRFHGTPNEASIGEATSNGCVRMFNEDVKELYDLVSTGTVVISTT